MQAGDESADRPGVCTTCGLRTAEEAASGDPMPCGSIECSGAAAWPSASQLDDKGLRVLCSELGVCNARGDGGGEGRGPSGSVLASTYAEPRAAFRCARKGLSFEMDEKLSPSCRRLVPLKQDVISGIVPR
mmetsp:Transcript_51771/g.135065  ORF Transcript_51771/g.135065 Transcript_51771/m.135065 type:complete len:131 (-) Transcript_51771:208-600(-)